jgi:hypothetical protein
LKYISVVDFKNTLGSPRSPAVPELQRGIFWSFGKNALTKIVVTFHPLGRFFRNIPFYSENNSVSTIRIRLGHFKLKIRILLTCRVGQMGFWVGFNGF